MSRAPLLILAGKEPPIWIRPSLPRSSRHAHCSPPCRDQVRLRQWLSRAQSLIGLFWDSFSWRTERKLAPSDPVAQDMGLTDVGRFGRRKQRQPLGLGEFAQKAKRPRPGPVL